MKKPNFFLVGAPKCGTTAMNHYLGTHPDIFMAIKEMHLFGRDLRFRAPFYRHNVQEYLAEFQSCNGQSRRGEASVWYLLSSQAASEIKSFQPAAKIIVMLRDPVEMLYSLYHQLRYLGDEHLPTFEEALGAEQERSAGREIKRHACIPQALVYRETARYSRQLERYFDAFGRENVLVIIYDDLVTDTLNVYRQTLQFLDVDPAYAPSHFTVINGGNKSIRFPAFRAIVKDPLLHSAAAIIRPRLPRKILGTLRALDLYLWKINTRFEKRRPLNPRLRSKLKTDFVPEVERLSELLGRDLTFWSQ